MLLLDTCAILWLMTRVTLAAPARAAIDAATQTGNVLVSPASAWEIGVAVAKGRLVLHQTPQQMFAALLALPGIRQVPLTPEIAIDASFLPGGFHADPGDRFLLATARKLDVPIVTRDAAIIRYGKEGHVRVLAC